MHLVSISLLNKEEIMAISNPDKYINEMFEKTGGEPIQKFINKIPAELGEFSVREQKSRQGISFTDWRMKWTHDIHVKKNSGRGTDTIQIVFFINNGMDWQMEGEKHVYMKQGELCMYRDKSAVSEGNYEGGRELRFKSIQIPTCRFMRIMEDCMDERIKSEVKCLLRSTSKLQATAYTKRLLTEIEETKKYNGVLADLHMEGKVWELVAVCFEEVMNGQRNNIISRTDKAAALQVRQRIIEDCVNVPDGEGLAKEAGISLSKLSRDFKEITGMSVHSFVIEQRLEHAAYLLAGNRLNVTQTAALCGYSNMSHFSSAFKKKYGVLPKDYRP